ncbi:hypothetical protein [Microbacterium sp. YY-01]|uniref:PH-like domain-containing protein n=1 Tax=Microbacterium sp. YY-01 TaxID=3421634 RepID=UPI003D17B551
MTHEAIIALVVLLVVGLLGLMAWGWMRRRRRDSALRAPLGVPEHAETLSRYEVLYVATTRRAQPLERLLVRPLAFRARGEIAVTDRGIAVSLDGTPTVFIDSARFVGIERASVTIDRVVERGGLVCIAWSVADDTVADSYFRIVSRDPAEFIEDIQRNCAAPEVGAHT